MIEFESVSKTFRDGTTAVQDLSLVVPSDKITVFVGPSGCGKTTTLRMVNRMLEPTKGRIVWDGNPLKSKRKTTLRRQMGYVIQNGGLFPHRSVLDNIGTVPGLLGWSKAKTRQRSLELLDNVGLDRKLANRFPAQLSGGQQQRVGVARALAADPLVMLMDEPFSAVDPVVRGELHEFFLGLQRQISKTIILITHDIDEAIKLGDQVVILRVGGRLAQAGTPQDLLDEPADAFVEGFVGRDRGYRSLSFLPSSGLSLDSVKVVRDVDAKSSVSEPTLVVDADARPVGWADRNRPGQVLGLGATFQPESDTLRVALDSALTSPVGLAVAVASGTGRFAGVVPAGDILAQITESRTATLEAISVRGNSRAEPEPTRAELVEAPNSKAEPDSTQAEPAEAPDLPAEPESSPAEPESSPAEPEGPGAAPVKAADSPTETEKVADAGPNEALSRPEQSEANLDTIVIAGVPVAEEPKVDEAPAADEDAPTEIRSASDDDAPTEIRPATDEDAPTEIRLANDKGDEDAPTEIRPAPEPNR